MLNVERPEIAYRKQSLGEIDSLDKVLKNFNFIFAESNVFQNQRSFTFFLSAFLTQFCCEKFNIPQTQ